ncbi:MAG TPA: secretin N-terminal domain-containing protein [candidate division Zixibacteria bacterium]
MRKRMKSKIGKLIGTILLVGVLCSLVYSQSSSPRLIKSLILQNADIHSVLDFLAEYGGVNIVVAPNVAARVSLSLKNVTWREALDVVLKIHGLTAVEEPNYLRVLLTGDYMKEQSELKVHELSQEALAPLVTEVIKIRNTAANDISNSLKGVLSGRGTVIVDSRTNSVVIRDIYEGVEKAKNLITVLDKETDQIKISAQLLDVQSGAIKELGVNWTLIPKLEGASNMTISQQANKVSDPIGNFTYKTFQTDFDLDGAISAMVSANKARVVAHPEITTVDNTEAFVQMGQKIPIKMFDQAGNIAIQLYEVGVILRVTPHITAENRILMKLEPERSSYQFDPNGIIINTSNAKTTVVVDNGQTTVIGGLTSQEEKEVRTGLPILKDIPLLGKLFSYTRKEVTNRDLVIFVTPTIVTKELKTPTVGEGEF